MVKGENQVDFYWANTQIDSNTIVFRVIDKPDVKVLSGAIPPMNAALVWSVGAGNHTARRACASATVGNWARSFNYRAYASRDESKLTLSQYMRC